MAQKIWPAAERGKHSQAMLLDVIDDCKETAPEQMRVQLIAAGWHPVTQHIWKHPNGALHTGPYGAWKKMCAELRTDGGKIRGVEQEGRRG